jgi:S1-C subfamily serine protease
MNFVFLLFYRYNSILQDNDIKMYKKIKNIIYLDNESILSNNLICIYKMAQLIFAAFILLLIFVSVVIFMTKQPQNWCKNVFNDSKSKVIHLFCQFTTKESTNTNNEMVSAIGFWVSADGYIITAAHNVFIEGSFVNNIYGIIDGEHVDIAIVGVDKHADIAVLKPSICVNIRSYFKFSETIAAGDEVILIGNTFTYDFQTFTHGYIRNPHWTDPTGVSFLGNITTSIPTAPGDSGSPIINRFGECVGIHTESFAPTHTDVDLTTSAFGGGLQAVMIKKVFNFITNNSSLKGPNINPIRGWHGFHAVPNSMLSQHAYCNALSIKYDANNFIQNKGYIVIRSEIDNINEGDVVTHINNYLIGQNPLQKSIGDEYWLNAPGSEIQVTYFSGKIKNQTNIQLQIMPDELDIPTGNKNFFFFLFPLIFATATVATVSIIAKVIRGSLVHSITEVKKGSKRKVDSSEQNLLTQLHQSMGKTPWNISDYRYIITEPYELEVYTSAEKDVKRTIIVPAGEVFDGDSMAKRMHGNGTDWDSKNNAWVYHDYLYRTHQFLDRSVCTRKIADDVMYLYLKKYDELPTYGFVLDSMDWAADSILEKSYKNSFGDGGVNLNIPRLKGLRDEGKKLTMETYCTIL